MMLTQDFKGTFSPFAEDEASSFRLAQEDCPWEVAEGENVAWDTATMGETSAANDDVEVDDIVAQYFGDVRRFPLLSRAEEQALWRRIERCKARVHHALLTSPVALPTLQEVWQQIERDDLPLQQIFDLAADADPNALRTRLAQALAKLQELAGHYQQLTLCDQARREQAPRAPRQERVRLWRRWIAVCDTLPLQSHVYKTLRAALEVAKRTTPENTALRTAGDICQRAQAALEQVQAQMLRANLRLVIYMANRYRGHGLPLLDLVQEGNMGLMHALEKFDPSRGLKFVTYAHWWVRQAISRALVEQQRTVRLPNHVVERQHKLRTAYNRLWNVHGRAPSVQELSLTLQCTTREVEELVAAGQPIVRLHMPLTEDGAMLADILVDMDAPKAEERVAEEQLHHRLAACLASLPEREALILRLRYGLETDHQHTLKEIGDLLGVSRERVRQLEKLALDKLRQPHHSALLADFTAVA
jgi:RNA polymerase primary sigma factor